MQKSRYSLTNANAPTVVSQQGRVLRVGHQEGDGIDKAQETNEHSAGSDVVADALWVPNGSENAARACSLRGVVRCNYFLLRALDDLCRHERELEGSRLGVRLINKQHTTWRLTLPLDGIRRNPSSRHYPIAQLKVVASLFIFSLVCAQSYRLHTNFAFLRYKYKSKDCKKESTHDVGVNPATPINASHSYTY